MELRDWCIHILSATTLEDKLFSPPVLTDSAPGPSLLWDLPSRPPNMQFKKHSKEERLPAFHEHGSQDHRAICLHRFAGHELLAVEIMAYALLAFPEASKSFRKGVAHTLKEEQEHVRLYLQRLTSMGVRFGDLPLYKHFWKHTPFLTSPLAYLSAMSLTFEMANLDFAPLYRESFTRHGDLASASLMNRILEDEIHHVSFGMKWLKRMKPASQSEWDCWRENVPPLLTIKRAKGFIVHEEPREKAGIPSSWIEAIKQA